LDFLQKKIIYQSWQHYGLPLTTKSETMKTYFFIIQIIKIVLPIIIGLWLNVAQAFKITPMVIETNATRGMASAMITVTHTGNETTYLRISSEPFTFNADNLELLKTSSQDLSHYLVFAPRKLTMKPGQSRRIRLNVRFLPSTKPGEYRSVIFTEPTKQSGERQMGVVPRIGVAMYVRKGDIKAQLSVLNATYKDKHIVLRAKNTGKATARPRVHWILSKSGQKIATGRNGGKLTVIAEGERNLRIDDNKFPEIKSLKSGTYQISGELAWGAREENSLSFEEEFVVP